MKNRFTQIPVVIVVLLLLTGCRKTTSVNDAEILQPGSRIITFAGYQWEVRSTMETAAGPGPNLFSDKDENVWVDNSGRLHLRITTRNGKWYCAGLTLLKSFSYGKYIFELASPVDTLDKNVVNGLFIYENDQQEVDIEFSKWGVADNMDAQFAVQPADKSGNKKRFFLNDTYISSTHWIHWMPDRIDFASFKGNVQDTVNADNIIQKWTYMGVDIPRNSDESVKINLWLFRGQPPSNLKETEVIISGFKIIED